MQIITILNVLKDICENLPAVWQVGLFPNLKKEDRYYGFAKKKHIQGI
jgi:hypothetical protein